MKNKFQNIFKSEPTLIHLLFTLVIIQIFVSFVVLTPLIINYDLTVYKNIMDGPGYLNFDFSNLKTILDQQRTFGTPFILKIYMIFDKELINWPKFIFIIYSFSNLIFFYSLVKANFSKIFSFFFILGLTFSHALYSYTAYLSELLGISFVILAFSFFFLSLKKNNIFLYIAFSIFLFFSYQIRPGFVVIVLFPIFYYFFRNFKFNIKVIFFSLGPLIIFLMIRFILIGHIGLVSFNAGLPAHSMVYLDKNEIYKLSPHNQELAHKFFDRKKQLYLPCNLDSLSDQYSFFNSKKRFEEPYKNNPYSDVTYGQLPCWNDYHMMTWLETIKIVKNIEVFKKGDRRNDIAWIHVNTLADFWNESAPLNEVNSILVNFSSEVFKIHKKEILLRLLKSPIYLVKLHRDLNNNLIMFYILIFLLILFINRHLKSEQKSTNNVSNESIFFLSLCFITGGNLIILYLHQNGTPRDTLTHTFYLVPLVMSYISFLISKNLSENIKI